MKEEKVMPTVRFALSDDCYEKLKEMAKKDGVSLQDCIRNRLFNLTTIYTPAEAVQRALDRHARDSEFVKFCLPDLYEGEWNLQRGPAGAFGKQFFKYVEEECADKIVFDKMIDSGRRAQYRFV